MATTRPKTLLAFAIVTPHGLRDLVLHEGDATLGGDPVLVVPSHANPALAPTGKVLAAVRAKWNVDFGRTTPLAMRGGVEGTHRVVRDGVGGIGAPELLLVRLRSAARVRAPDEHYRSVMWTLFGSLAALEMDGGEYRSVGIPLIAGSRDYGAQDTAPALVDLASRWLRYSRHTYVVNLYAVDPAVSESWRSALQQLKRHEILIGEKGQAFLPMACARLLEQAAMQGLAGAPVFRGVWHEMETALRALEPNGREIGGAARKLLEVWVADRLAAAALPPPGSDTLCSRIERLRAKGRIENVLEYQLHTIRELGNRCVHNTDGRPFEIQHVRMLMAALEELFHASTEIAR